MATIKMVISPHGKVAYRVRVRLKGHSTETASFTSLAEAQAYADRTEATLRNMPTRTPDVNANVTLGDAIGRYLQEVLPGKRPATIISQGRQLKWWIGRMGNQPLSSITPAMVNDCKNILIQNKRGGSTVNRYLAVLRHLYVVAKREWDLPTDNPVAQVKRCTEPRGRTRFLSDDERIRLLEACKESRNPVLYPVVILALSTGARKMEILSLRWEDVDLAREVMHVRESKNGNPRMVPLTGLALDLLKDMVATRLDNAQSEYIFASPNGNKPYKIETTWRTALRKADIRDFRFHDLRHTAASYLAMQGCTLVDIAAVLGHLNLSTTMRYAHVAQSHTRGILERMTSTL